MPTHVVLLTGATGLIGRHVAAKLASVPQLQLVCIVRGGEGHPEAARLRKQGVVIFPGSFYDAATIEDVFER